MKQFFTHFVLFVCFCFNVSYGQILKSHQQPSLLNPILPGYFADPTIKKIGDTYYIYATTDGNGWGAGPSQVWTSKDFLNWTIQPMNWPNTHWYWAPDMTKGYDGRYYLYYSQPVEIFGAVSDSPTGPWESIGLGSSSIIPNYLIPGVITLDAQTFIDDDGRIYMFWGTWGIYPDHGCAVGLLNPDMKSFEKIELIPNTVAKEFFEAPFMFKRNGVYYMMYSSGHCEDHTYRVQYVKSKAGPMGPFEYPIENPILVTNEDGTIHGPGHHSIIEEDGHYYIVYHRHNNPHSGGGFHRQIAVDEIFFDEHGDIKKVKPTHEGVGRLIKSNELPKNIALGKPVKASSFYNEDFRPEFAMDDNNGTLWRAKENDRSAWITVDLGFAQQIGTVLIQFEYPTYAYQYRIETSEDGQQWTMYADRANNNQWSSPTIESKDVKARYVRLHIDHTQLPGLPKGVWNIKVFEKGIAQKTTLSGPQEMPVKDISKGQLLHIHADKYQEGERLSIIKNVGILMGDMVASKPIPIQFYQGKKAFLLDGNTSLQSTFPVPESLAGNSSFTVSMWVNNPEVSRVETVLAWSKGNQDLAKALFGFGSDPQRGAIIHGSWPDLGYSSVPQKDQWHHVVFSFDGYMERIYVDGVLQKEANRMLFVRQGDRFVIGASDRLDNLYSGYLSDLKVYNECLSAEDVQRAYSSIKKGAYSFVIQTDDLPLGKISEIRNHASVENQMFSCMSCEVDVMQQRIALRARLIQDDHLSSILQKNNYTIEFDAYDGQQWHHVLWTNRNAVGQLYLNSKPAKNSDLGKFVAFVGQRIHFKANGFNFLRASQGIVTDGEVLQRFDIWKKKQESPVLLQQMKLIVAPTAINKDKVFVQVGSDVPGVHYSFSTKKQHSGWIKQPYHVFDRKDIESDIVILTKDEFGNTSLPLIVRPKITDPTQVFKSEEQMVYDLSMSRVPLWEAYSVSPLLDSTKTFIQLKSQVWNLGSKHTRWGEANLSGPFVYREIDGDFTIQVRVKDVAGLSTRTRTSGEVGIMIQDSEKVSSYINNTVLTGWNLGNLIRSVGSGHQENNNGTGLEFKPYLQVQKSGNDFFLRCSSDGETWEDLITSPIKREDWEGKKLKVGLYQIAGNNQYTYGEIDDIRIYLH